MKKVIVACLLVLMLCSVTYGAGRKFFKRQTQTGLDSILFVIKNDEGLLANTTAEDRDVAATSAHRMNAIIIDALRTTNTARDGIILPDELYDVNARIREKVGEDYWRVLHGDDEGDTETGYHRVQNDGALWNVYGENGIDTVFDGIYHMGFEIQNDRFLNEDGDENATLEDVAYWLNMLLEEDLKRPIIL